MKYEFARLKKKNEKKKTQTHKHSAAGLAAAALAAMGAPDAPAPTAAPPAASATAAEATNADSAAFMQGVLPGMLLPDAAAFLQQGQAATAAATAAAAAAAAATAGAPGASAYGGNMLPGVDAEEADSWAKGEGDDLSDDEEDDHEATDVSGPVKQIQVTHTQFT